MKLKPLKATDVWGRTFAYAYVLGLVGLLVGLGYAAYSVATLGLTVETTVNATINVGWIIELFLGGLVVGFLLTTLVMITRIAGVGFINSLIGTIRSIAHDYSDPSRDESE
jgi:hypothetical protein